jgi:flagellar hook-length control protein FliK
MFVMPHAGVSPLAAAAGLVTPAAVSVVETQVRDQIVQSLRVQLLQGGGEATIELNPEVLGKVRVAVKVDGSSVTATVQAATAQVREWVTTHRDELSQTLAQQGLRLDKLEVAEAPKEQPARDQAREQRQAPRESGRQRRDDRARDTDTFELQDPQETV